MCINITNNRKAGAIRLFCYNAATFFRKKSLSNFLLDLREILTGLEREGQIVWGGSRLAVGADGSGRVCVSEWEWFYLSICDASGIISSKVRFRKPSGLACV